VAVVTGTPNQLVAFMLEGQSYALRLKSVERIVRMVEVTPLPGTPGIVLGVINVQGQLVPVLDMRRRFGLPKRELNLTDQLVIARTAKRTMALGVDSVSGIVARLPQEITDGGTIFPGLEFVQGVVKLQDGILLIHDIDRFLSLDEDIQLESALIKT
jgi:purine-binding chemotaxis protein CheW